MNANRVEAREETERCGEVRRERDAAFESQEYDRRRGDARRFELDGVVLATLLRRKARHVDAGAETPTREETRAGGELEAKAALNAQRRPLHTDLGQNELFGELVLPGNPENTVSRGAVGDPAEAEPGPVHER